MIKIHVRGFRIIVTGELVLLQLNAMHIYKELLWGKNVFPTLYNGDGGAKHENFPTCVFCCD